MFAAEAVVHLKRAVNETDLPSRFYRSSLPVKHAGNVILRRSISFAAMHQICTWGTLSVEIRRVKP